MQGLRSQHSTSRTHGPDRHNLVGGAQLLELLIGALVVRVLVRVKLHGPVPVRALDVGLGAAGQHAQLVVQRRVRNDLVRIGDVRVRLLQHPVRLLRQVVPDPFAFLRVPHLFAHRPLDRTGRVQNPTTDLDDAGGGPGQRQRHTRNSAKRQP